MFLRGIRGAISVESNSKEAIVAAAKELLNEMKNANQLEISDVASVIFTVTGDLNAAFPAEGARELGWIDTPLLCAKEIDVPGGLPRCLRILLHVNTEKKPDEIRHIYLREAKNLRR